MKRYKLFLFIAIFYSTVLLLGTPSSFAGVDLGQFGILAFQSKTVKDILQNTPQGDEAKKTALVRMRDQKAQEACLAYGYRKVDLSKPILLSPIHSNRAVSIILQGKSHQFNVTPSDDKRVPHFVFSQLNCDEPMAKSLLENEQSSEFCSPQALKAFEKQEALSQMVSDITLPLNQNPFEHSMGVQQMANSQWPTFPQLGYTKPQVDLLLDLFMGRNPDAEYLPKKNPSKNDLPKKVGYTHVSILPVGTKAVTDTAFRQFEMNLKSMINQGGALPSKIFIPTQIYGGGQLSHAMLLLIETQPDKKRKLTVINSAGSGEVFHAYEQKLIATAAAAFGDVDFAQTTERVTQVDSFSCGLHMVENIRLLAKQPNATQFVHEEKIPVRELGEVHRVFQEHKSKAAEVYNALLKKQVVSNR
jgi:hypothetical protein